MQNNDRVKFASLMKVLGETFGNTIPSKEKMEIYFRALSDLTIDQVDESVIRLVNTRKISSTFPVPAELRDAISGGESAAIIALTKAEKAVEQHGSYSAVVFDDPIIHMTIRAMGGWPKFCCPTAYGDEQEWHWKQKEFKSLYETFSKHPRSECLKVLVGLGDTSYERDGKTILISPEYVGDKQMAIEWTSKSKTDLLTDGHF